MESVPLQSLIKTTVVIAEQLARLKNDVQRQLSSATYPDVSPINYIQRAIKLRQLFRQIADGIQAKRGLAQIQKEKIERSKNFYEGLQYYKTTLINKITQTQIDVVDLNQYYETPLQIDNWVENFEEVESRMDQELVNKHRKNQEYQALIKLKAEKQENRKVKANLYQKVIPEKAKRIYEEVMSAASLLDCKELQPIQGIRSYQLSLFYEKISKLRLENTIGVTFSQQGSEQLQITILKNDFYLYKMICANNITIKEPQTKFIVTSLPGDKLVIGLHRRQDFSNEQVFQRLINFELIKPVFPHPKNQNERNTNSKYIRVRWLQQSLPNGILRPPEMINTIKRRVFSLNLLHHLIQSIKKLSFYQVPMCSQQSKYQYQKLQPQLIKKSVSAATLEKIKFQQFLNEIHVPHWVDSYRAKYVQLQIQIKKMSLTQEQKANPGIQNFIKLIHQLKLGEIVEPNLNSYYKGSFTIHQNKLEYILIVPFNYPNKPSSIKITNWIKKREDDKKPIAFPVGLKKVKVAQQSRKNVWSRILMFEQIVNKQPFLLPDQYQAYLVLMQINLLITLLYTQGDKKT